jgi:hypothetical protein
MAPGGLLAFHGGLLGTLIFEPSAQGLGERRDIGIALSGIGCQRPRHDASEGRRRARQQRLGVGGGQEQPMRRRAPRRSSLETPLPGQELVEQDTQREHLAHGRARSTLYFLGTPVVLRVDALWVPVGADGLVGKGQDPVCRDPGVNPASDIAALAARADTV